MLILTAHAQAEIVRRSDSHAVEAPLTQAFLYMLKAKDWPLSSAVPGWQAEARRFSPSMRQLIDMAGLYADALGESLGGLMRPRPLGLYDPKESDISNPTRRGE
jgi:hypothetical protein